MAISRQWRGKAICVASSELSFPIDYIFWARLLRWDCIWTNFPSPSAHPVLTLSLLSSHKHALSSCPPARNKSRNNPLIHDKHPSALLRAEDGADSQWCGWGGEKSGQFKLKDLRRVAGSSCMEVWHTICMYHGNSGAPGAAGVSHHGGDARVVCLFLDNLFLDNMLKFNKNCVFDNFCQIWLKYIILIVLPNIVFAVLKGGWCNFLFLHRS